MSAKKSYDLPPVIPHSGPSGLLAGFDSRDREIASSTGGTVTAKLLKREGPHVPKEKGWTLTDANYCEPIPRHHSVDSKSYPKTAHAKEKIKTTMHEFGKSTLHSGSKTGPVVTSRKQAVAIALSQARKKS